MKLSCLQEHLRKGLTTVGRAVPTRTTLPITNNVLLATDRGRLKLVATNLEIAISSWIAAKTEEDGAITVPARLLTEFVDSLPNERIDLEYSTKGKVVHLRCLRFEAHISGMDAEDFPPIPSIGEGLTAKVEASRLRSAITRVEFAAAKEDTRPVLTGIHAEFSGETLTLAAADGFRLAVDVAQLVEPVADKIAVIVPAKSLAELARLLGDQEEPVHIIINPAKSQVLFQLKNVELVSQLIQGTFPNYQQLIPQSHSTRAVMDAGEFLRATRTASIFARDASGIVRIQVGPGAGAGAGKVTVSARAEEIGDNSGEIDAVVEGEAAKIAFNSKYLAEVLAVLDKGQVALETSSPSSPGVIRPVGKDSYVHVVMPMFVQW